MDNITVKESRCIYYMKAFAIISVVCAHVSVVPKNFSLKSQIICKLLNEIGAIGVGIFFAVSGFLFYSKKNKQKKWYHIFFNKLQVLGLPWIVSATLVYIYVAVRKGGDLLEYCLSIIGYLSSYWYLSVLLILFLIFAIVINCKYETFLTFLLSITTVLSVFLRMMGIIPENALGVYLNVFNWILFFGLGFLVSKYWNVINKKISLNKAIVISTTALLVGLLFLLACSDEYKFSYFSVLYVPIELLAIFVSFEVCKYISNKQVKLLSYLGKMSFGIYLYNELLWAGLVVYIGNRYDSWLLLFFRPIIVLLLVCIELETGKWLFQKIGKKELFCRVFGIK